MKFAALLLAGIATAAVPLLPTERVAAQPAERPWMNTALPSSLAPEARTLAP